jgi:hypothetical protein
MNFPQIALWRKAGDLRPRELAGEEEKMSAARESEAGMFAPEQLLTKTASPRNKETGR